MPAPQLSIIVPAYNEEARIGPTLERLLAWLEESGVDGEILPVDDGSRDATVEVVQEVAGRDPRVRLLSYGTNRGKGAAVGFGVDHARGERILFSDADLSTPIEEYAKLARALEDADIAIGSRALAQSQLLRRQPIYREWMGRSFNLLVRTFVMGGLHDTQCGFKLFRADAAKRCFGERTLDGFAFDVEILFVAQRLGLRVAEVPVRWEHVEASRIDPVKHSAQMFRDILKVRMTHRRLRR